MHRRLPAPSLDRDDLPCGLREVLLACLSVDPARRPRLVDVRSELRRHV